MTTSLLFVVLLPHFVTPISLQRGISHRPLLFRPHAGKGDETIKEINRFQSVVIDPALAADESFWTYALVVNEQGGFRLCVFGDGEDAEELLVRGGADIDDVSYYDIFNKVATHAAPPFSAFVVSTASLPSVDAKIVSEFYRVVRVGRELVVAGDESSDIYVHALSELRALSICSYALLNKKC
jgi:hypothetical protein